MTDIPMDPFAHGSADQSPDPDAGQSAPRREPEPEWAEAGSAEDDLACKEGLQEWKKEALRQFESWLNSIDAIPEAEPEDGSHEEPDLYSFFAQMAAANAESRKANRRTAEAFSQWADTLTRLDGDVRLLREQLSRQATGNPGEDVLSRGHCLVMVELLDRMARLSAALAAPPVSPWWKGNTAAWQRAWDTLRRGFEITVGHFEGFLRQEGIARVPTLNQPFDPLVMAAVEAVSGTDLPENTVVEETAPGYLLRGELLRPAQVKVAVRKT